MTGARIGAFFDVDETLITGKSMFDFLRFHLADPHTSVERQARRWAELDKAIRTGTLSRAEVNRDYYRIYQGLPADQLAEQGARWFARQRALPGFTQPEVLRSLVRHRLAGHVVVLVTGSFPACVDPLRDAVGAQHVLCSRPVVDADGMLTGEIERPMIGEAKADAMRDLAGKHGVSLPLSFGYGDHASDLPLLLEVGHPVVVGTDPVLDEYAERNQWLRLGTAVAA